MMRKRTLLTAAACLLAGCAAITGMKGNPPVVRPPGEPAPFPADPFCNRLSVPGRTNTVPVVILVIAKDGNVDQYLCEQPGGGFRDPKQELPVVVTDGTIHFQKRKDEGETDPCVRWKIDGSYMRYCW